VEHSLVNAARLNKATSMSRKTLWPLLICLALFTGCIEFGEQTLTYRYDLRTDTLRMFQDYRGIFGADDRDTLSDDEVGQLESVLKGGRTFFFANWIFEFNRAQFQEQLEKLKDTEERKKMGWTDDGVAKLEKLFGLLIENVRVENGDFYSDAKGRLCGVQRVTITQASKIIAAINPVLKEHCKAEAAGEGTSPEDKAAYLKAASGSQDFIRLEGNCLTLSWSMTRSDYDKMVASESTANKQLQEFKRSGGTVSFANEVVTWTLGSPTNTLTSLTLSMSEKPYAPNAVEAVKKRSSIRKQFDPQAAAKEFLK
jgi:hypothetical protein